MHENLGIAVLFTVLRKLLQLREGALPKLSALAMGSWGLAISEVILGFLEVALVCSGLLRSLKSPCVTVGLQHCTALLSLLSWPQSTKSQLLSSLNHLDVLLMAKAA